MYAIQWLDTQLFSSLNSLHNTYFDGFMWLATRPQCWLVMLAAFLFVAFRRDKKMAFAAVVAIGLVVLLADQVSSSIIKPLVERPRPSRAPLLYGTVHVVAGYRGGPFGFVSSHAANCFGIALFVAMAFRHRALTAALVCWAFIMMYSRIYLGVHYPGDILGGMVVGTLSALAALWLYRFAERRYSLPRLSGGDARIVAMAMAANLAIIAVSAAFFIPKS